MRVPAFALTLIVFLFGQLPITAPASADCVNYRDYLHLAGNLPMPGRVNSVAVSSPYAYLAVQGLGLAVVDVSDSDHPWLVGSVALPGNAVEVALSGAHAFVVLQGSRSHPISFEVIDITDPASPRVVADVDLSGVTPPGSTLPDLTVWPCAVAVWGPYACVVGGGQLVLLDMTHPEHPSIIGRTLLPGGAIAAAVSGAHAFVTCQTSSPAGWKYGMQVVDISDPGGPRLAGWVGTPSAPQGLDVQGSYAYIADGSALEVVDVADPEHPRTVAQMTTGIGVVNVAVAGTHAFITTARGIHVADLTVPSNPQLMGGIGLYGSLSMAATDTHAYVGMPSGLQVVDATNPHNPTVVLLGVRTYCVAISGSVACASWGSRTAVIDVTDPENPQVEGSFSTSYAFSIVIAGTYAYIADINLGLHVADIADPWNPWIVTTLPVPFSAEGVDVSGNYAYVVGSRGPDGDLAVVDIVNPHSPQLVGFLDLHDTANNVMISGGYAFVANESSGLRVIDVSDPAHPWIVASLMLPEHARTVAVSGQYAYVAALSHGLQVIDISVPWQPRITGSVRTPFAWGVSASGTTAYVADTYHGLVVIDVSDHAQPTVLGGVDTNYAETVQVAGGYVYVGHSTMGLVIVPAQCDALSVMRNTAHPRHGARLTSFPNPAPGLATVRLALPASGRVSATIYDVLGREVRRLRSGVLPAGIHDIPWDGRDDAGSEVAAGVYLARVWTPDEIKTARIVMVR